MPKRSVWPRIGIIAGWTIMIAGLGMLLSRWIVLPTADLGRHLANGKYILDGLGPFSSNFYSYTHQEYPVPNHHWGTGVLFYLVHSLGGWVGLHVFSILIAIGAFALFFRLAEKRSNFLVPFILSLMTIPLIGRRVEIRPENFSYLLLGAVFYLLWRWRDGTLDRKWLWALPPIMCLWINLHIYWVFGGLVIFLVFLEQWILSRRTREKRSDALHVLKTGAVAFAALFLNPTGWRLVLYPLGIFNDYQFRIAENQSIPFFYNRGTPSPDFYPYYAVAGLFVLSVGALLIRKRRSIHVLDLMILTLFLFMAFNAVRNLAILGLVSLPLLSPMILQGWRAVFPEGKRFHWFDWVIFLPLLYWAVKVPTYSSTWDWISAPLIIPVVLWVRHYARRDPARLASRLAGFGIAIGIFWCGHQYGNVKLPRYYSGSLGWGHQPNGQTFVLLPEGEYKEHWPGNVTDSAYFFSRAGLTGPIFNNYDLGGFLIYSVFPKEKVFVDNRPEAYPGTFFTDEYEAALRDDGVWETLLAQHDFNLIWFHRNDMLPESQDFLIRRMADPHWHPVFWDSYTVIFVRQLERNRAVLERWALPKSLWGVGPPDGNSE
jgi:hypothetical protein